MKTSGSGGGGKTSGFSRSVRQIENGHIVSETRSGSNGSFSSRERYFRKEPNLDRSLPEPKADLAGAGRAVDEWGAAYTYNDGKHQGN